MADYEATSNMTLEAAITAGSMADGENLTISSGAIVTCDQTPSILIGRVIANNGQMFIDGENISAGNMINFVGEYQEYFDINGNGALKIRGDWYSIGTTNGANSQTFSLATYYDSSFCVDVIPMIQVETGRRIDYDTESGIDPLVDDWVSKSSDTSLLGRIVEVNISSKYLIVKFLTGSLINNDDIEIRKVIDSVGPIEEITWTAKVNNVSGDIKESGVYQEFGNTRANGTSYIGDYHHGVGGFVFDNAFQSTTLTMGTAAGSTGGFVPPSSCDVRLPNCHISTSNITNYGSNNTYHDGTSTEANWYRLDTLGAGTVDIEVCNAGSAWISSSNAYAFDATHFGGAVSMGSRSCANKTTFTSCVLTIDPMARAYDGGSSFATYFSFLGSDIVDCLTTRSEKSGYPLGAQYSSGITITGCIVSYPGIAAISGGSTAMVYFNSCDTVTLDNNAMIGPDNYNGIEAYGLTNSEITNTIMSMTQDETAESASYFSGIDLGAECDNILIKGWRFLGSGYPSHYGVRMNASTIKIRAIGIIDDRITASGIAGGFIYNSGSVIGLDVSRVFLAGVRLFNFGTTNLIDVVMQNCSGSSSTVFSPKGLTNTLLKGVDVSTGIVDYYEMVAVYGQQIHDAFRSSTTGYLVCFSIPPSAEIDNVTVVSGGPSFDKAGNLDMISGDVIEIEQDYSALGHTAFDGDFTAAIGYSSWGNDEWTNVTVEFQYDLGSGWNGSWLNVRTATNLTSITGMVDGIKIKLRYTATGTQTGMTYLALHTTTTIASQKANLYPIDQNEVTLQIKVVDKNKNVIESVQTAIFKTDGTELMNEDTTSLGIAEATFIYSTDTDIIVKCRKSDEADDPRYKAYSTTGTILSTGFYLTVTLEESLVLN